MESVKHNFIITGGFAYTDIDVLASACAYNQCMSIQGYTTQVILRAPFNETICDSIKNWGYDVSSEVPISPEQYHYVLVDVSDPKYFEQFVVHENISEVIDHHFGFEEYWKEQLGEKGCVEHVGSCATLVWERFKQFGLENQIGVVEANLLFTAIFANTLNLQAQVTTQRDTRALKELEKFTQLPKEWISKYYNEVSHAILENPIKAIKKDTKKLNLFNVNVSIAQLELWNADPLLKSDNLLLLGLQTSNGNLNKSLLIISEVATRTTYFVSGDLEMQNWISKITKSSFNNNIAPADRLWMRKEVVRELQLLSAEQLPVG